MFVVLTSLWFCAILAVPRLEAIRWNRDGDTFTPNKDEHARDGLVVGLFTGVLVAVFRSQSESRPLSFGDLVAHGLTGASMGILGTIFPDIVDPATHPNHRGVFHTPGLVSTLGAIIAKNMTSEQWGSDVLMLGAPALAGYVVHLRKDSNTTNGLPRLLRWV